MTTTTHHGDDDMTTTIPLRLTSAAASELTMSVYDTMPTDAEPARVEVAEAVYNVPRRGGVVNLSAPAWAWLLDWLRAETEDRASSRYTGAEMFGAWRALVALRRRMEEHAAASIDDDAPVSLLVNFGHGEYGPGEVDGLDITEVFTAWAPEHEELYDHGDDAALLERARAAGAGSAVDEYDVGFSVVLRLTGSRAAHERGLAAMLDGLRGVSTGSDDDFYDYFPSGVRAASSWSTALYGDTTRVEAVLAEVLDDEQLQTLRDEGRL